MKSLTEATIQQLLSETLPSYQAVSPRDLNLGLGFLYYGFTRAIRPRKVCVIGSKAGFSVIAFALGIKHNAGSTIKNVTCWDTELCEEGVQGSLYFVDPSPERNDSDHWYGIGFWDDEEKTNAHWQKFGVDGIVRHYKTTSADFLKHSQCPLDIDLLYIDGDHSIAGITHDFNNYYDRLSGDAIILAHDVDPRLKIMDPSTGGYEALMQLDKNRFEVFRLPVFPGLAIVRKLTR
jgi:predicted O-methyltransferase YrrM